MIALKPPDQKLFFAKNDPLDLRLGDLASFQAAVAGAKAKDLFNNDFALQLWGYPDDEGILLNGGRLGAKEAPFWIRNYLYRMTPDLFSRSVAKIADFGDLATDEKLETRHQQARDLAYSATQQEKSWVSLGGGHDYGFPDSAGFCQAMIEQGKTPIVINFDAHLDVRPSDKGFNSGTPFYRLLAEFERKIHFFEVGIQAQCNSRHHLQWAQEKGAQIISLLEIADKGLLPALKNRLNSFLQSPVFVSLDLDCFTSNEAPGCSQSWTSGLNFREFSGALKWLTDSFSVRGLGLYEVSPPLDFDHQTSKLAALIVHQYLSSLRNT